MKNQPHFIKLLLGVAMFLGVAILLLLNGCSKTGSGGSYGSGSNNNNNNNYNNGSGSSVAIQNFSFTSSDLHITKGTTVVWTNKDNVTHTVTADDGSFTSGNIAPGGTYSRAFTAVATIHYHCSIHTYMTGDVVVQ